MSPDSSPTLKNALSSGTLVDVSSRWIFDERAAAAFGRDIYWMKLKAYVFEAAFGGLADGLFAANLSAFNPSAWSPMLS